MILGLKVSGFRMYEFVGWGAYWDRALKGKYLEGDLQVFTRNGTEKRKPKQRITGKHG